MSPIVFSIGDFELRWYSLLILAGVLIAYFLIMHETKRQHMKSDFMFNLIFWALIFGILGARLYYVLFNLDYYLDNFVEIFKIWNGGLAIHGGLIAGLITIIVYCKKYKVNIKKVLDIVAPALLLAQAIGRWGNFFNSEAYGSAVSYQTLLDMKIIPQFIIDNMYIGGEYHLPMFYFESIAAVIGVIIMLIIRRFKYIKCGQVISFYLIWYGAVRFVIEIFRTDSLMLADFKVAQIASIVMIIAGLYIMVTQSQKPKLDELYNRVEKEIKF